MSLRTGGTGGVEAAPAIGQVPSRRAVGLTAVGGLAVFIASALVVADGRVRAPEARVFHWINDWPDQLEPVLWVFQLCGVLLVPLVVATAAWFLGRRRLAVLLAVLVPLKLLVEHGVVKQLVHRERPGTTICHLDRGCASFRNVPLTGPSFVSGHAIIAWSVATLLWFHLPRRWRWVPVAVAAANSVARVYLGAHSPLDLVGGAGVGVALGALVLLAATAVWPVRRRGGFAAEPVTGGRRSQGAPAAADHVEDDHGEDDGGDDDENRVQHGTLRWWGGWSTTTRPDVGADRPG